MSFTQLAERSGVDRRTFYNWKVRGVSPRLADIEAALNVLGYELVAKERDDMA